MATIHKGSLDGWRDVVQRAKQVGDESFDWSKEPEVQTDKNLIKILPCNFCQRPLIVSTFYVAAWAKCSPCAGAEGDTRKRGSVEVPQAGRTEPALVKDLTKVLVNPAFANALCPVHPDDEDHAMELKSVHHNAHHGPGFFTAKNAWHQIAPGEVVMHQCTKCNAVVTYSTAVTQQFRRCNEESPGDVKHSDGWATTLGVREVTDPDEVSAA